MQQRTIPSDNVQQKTAEDKDDNFFVSPLAVNLPKGGGAIRGIGEKFAANPVTGTGSLTVPIATSPGRSGFGTQLSLSYDSGAGNGPFGFGWSLSTPAITRKTDKGLPRYLDAEESDVFLLSGAEDLVPVFVKDGSGEWVTEDGEYVIHEVLRTADGADYLVRRYRPRIEGLFARIERWTRSDGDVHWRSFTKDNILTLYGKDAKSRIADPDDPRRVFSWLICETRDDRGNAVLYEYKPEDGAGIDLAQAHERNRGSSDDARRAANRYLKRIRYGNQTPLLDSGGMRPVFLPGSQAESVGWMFELVLDYGEHDPAAPEPGDAGQWSFRADPFSTYRAGFEVRTTRLCRRALMFHHFEAEADVGAGCLVRSTDFTYSHEQDPTSTRNPVYTFLMAVTQVGYRRQEGGYLSRSLPPVTFEYSLPTVQDVLEEVDPGSLENLPAGLDGTTYIWTDLHGEGIPGILTEQAGAWFYKRNLSPMSGGGEVRLAPLEQVASRPNLSLAGGAQLMDLASDGQPDLVALGGPMPGLYEHDDAEGWQLFRPFTSALNRDTQDPNLRFVDLDGNGHADVLITEDGALVWHASLAEQGFGPARRIAQALDEEKGPRLVLSDGAQSIYLADMSGDGLTDLVRIRDGEVCYWPNLGYGRFGPRVTMDYSPHFDTSDQFDHQRLRLADVDGTGTTDIIYLHGSGVRLYFNQSGNSWSAPHALGVFPRVDELAGIMPVDLLGNGTACLVWSSPLPGDAARPMRYVNLMGAQKPHLLVKIANNLGAETRITYAPSTQFYLRDKRDGRPWITRLPFPVHVVERVEVYDHISRSRFTTRYAYHHGYFDGVEREFRGFAMVEQWDTQEMAVLAGDGALPPAANVDAASHVPPVHTRSWFHTGVYLDRERVSRQLEGEYYAGDDALLLPDTLLPSGLTREEELEACRALKGAMLRQEVYALDGTDEAEHPYSVVEQNFTVERLQPKGGNPYAVFFTYSREAITYHYERNPADPRIQHALTLEVDGFGNVLREAATGYGRRQPDMSLPAEDRARQAQMLLTYTENRVTNTVDAVGDYRTPLPCQTVTYELTGIEPEDGAAHFSFDEWVRNGFALPVSAGEIAYEQVADGISPQKRPIEHIRSLYRRDDLAGLLPLGQVETLALPGESYKLALTPGLLAQVFERDGQPLLPNAAAVLGGQGGYAPSQELKAAGLFPPSDPDGHWWTPSGRVFLSPGSGDAPGQELGYARQHFFLPHRFRDPFQSESVIAYDAYDLLMLETRDALGNRVTVGERLTDGSIDAGKPGHDYRVLQPRWVMDPNRNRTQVAFDTLGLVVATAVMGKPEESAGDSLDGFAADLAEADLIGHLDDPLAGPHAILGGATTRLVVDLFAYWRTRDEPDPQPAVVYTLARETHAADLEPGQQTKIQHSFSYSDGFGREIQKKIQAEAGPVPQRDTTGAIIVGPDGQPAMTESDASPRWVGSGWTVFNNKGDPVRQYEPFFTDTHHFELDVRIGVSPTLFYDPPGRLVATLHPNHTWEKVLFDPWRQETWDVSDTMLVADPADDPDVGDFFRRLPGAEYLPTWYGRRQVFGALGPDEQDAADKASNHAATPTTAHADALGRAILTIAHNAFKLGSAPVNDPPVEAFYHTRAVYDVEGNQRAVVDAKDRTVMSYDYDLLGSRVHQASMDGGERWMLADVAGQLLYAWDSRGHTFRTACDVLRRPTHLYVQAEGEAEILVERTVYGEAHPQAGDRNLRGRAYQQVDGAGAVTSEQYDFKGNLLGSHRRLAAGYKQRADWSALDGLDDVQAIAAAAGPLLEPETFNAGTAYDALNRPVSLTMPDGSQVLPAYNEANLLEAVEAHLRGAAALTIFVADIEYDARGQRTHIAYGSGVETAYHYDRDTFRLVRLQTTRPGGGPLQDLRYAYDPPGNITSIRDHAQQTVYFDNTVVEPHAAYTYDALYRLIEATEREHIGQTSNNLPGHRPEIKPHYDFNDSTRRGLAHPHDGQAMRGYTERYEYDPVGNILAMIHQAGGGSWTRHYDYTAGSNRLLSTSLPGDPDGGPYSATYAYDAHGSMTQMLHLPEIGWDFENQMQQVDLGGGGTVYFVYDAAGERVRKVHEHGGLVEERIYLGGYEVYRKHTPGGLALERETLHIMDDQQRIALVETKTVDAGQPPATNPQPLIRYQLGNHLGSASLEVDEQGQVISYEEYTPYGSTSYQAGPNAAEVSLKRYRYTGKEKDDETGLYYHGARYYAPWLGRWTAADPAGLADGPNLYLYVRDNPAVLVDPNGKTPKPGTASYQVMTKTDTQLIAHLKSMTPEQRGSFAAATSGAFNTRVEAARRVAGLSAVYTLPEVKIEGKVAKESTCNRCHETPEWIQEQFDQKYEKVIPGFGPEPVSMYDLEVAFGPPTPMPTFTEAMAMAWERGSTADRVEIAATGVGVGSMAIPYAGDYVGLGASIVVFGAKPSWGAFGDVALDVPGAIFPFVPALGTVRRGEKLLDAADTATDLQRTTTKVDDAYQAATDTAHIDPEDLAGMSVHGPRLPQQQGRQFREDWLGVNEFDPSQPSHVRGYLKNRRMQGKPGTPPGKVMAHGHQTPAREGFDYSNSSLSDADLNMLEEIIRRQYGKK